MKSKSKLTKKSKATLGELIAAAKEAGGSVTISLQASKMPLRFPNDPEAVRLLLDESERVNKLGNAWITATVPNAVAGEFWNAWAFALAAHWLRCKLKGEFDKLEVKGEFDKPR